MLVLGRKKGESVLIGEDIEITILDVQADQVKIGIAAPRHLSVLRKELYVSIEENNRGATETLSLQSLQEQMKKLKKSP